MKSALRNTKASILALLLAGAAPAAAQAPAAAPLPDADPAMWVVKDADTTIYMFGTFHLLDGKQAWFNDEVKTAFDASDELVLEAMLPENPADLQPLVMKYAVDPAGKTLSSKLEPDVKTELEKQLGALGVPLAAFETFEPWFVSMTLATLSAQKLGLTGEHGPETVLSKAARAEAMPVSELEGVEFQLALFDEMPEAAQVASLGQSLDQIARIDEVFKPMLAAWSAGDTETLVTILNEGMSKTPELYETLFTRRNATWAEWVDARMDKPGTVFMAVGAGHLAGKDSVQAMLAAKGFKPERVQ